jgi:glycerophosphoryl diester phosphodiesterase
MKINCQYISHAAGEINSIKYSNSAEALQQSYELGYKFIEIDISLTSDNEFVLIHDWYKTRKYLFNKKGTTSKKHFLKDKMIKGLTPMSLDMALIWLENHPDVYFISDVKNTNISKVLKYINIFFPQIKKRFIPQIYAFNEYSIVKKLGYSEIILILYKLTNSYTEIIKFVETNPLLAISLSKAEAYSNLAISLQKIPVDIIVYTINNITETRELNKLGINKFFTDSLR